jgi:hypothetical protein
MSGAFTTQKNISEPWSLHINQDIYVEEHVQRRTTNILVLQNIVYVCYKLGFERFHVTHFPYSRYSEGDIGLGPPNQSIRNMFSISNL